MSPQPIMLVEWDPTPLLKSAFANAVGLETSSKWRVSLYSVNVRPGLLRCQMLLLQLMILVVCALVLLHQSTLPKKVVFTICTLVIFLLLTFHESYLHTHINSDSPLVFGIFAMQSKTYGKFMVNSTLMSSGLHSRLLGAPILRKTHLLEDAAKRLQHLENQISGPKEFIASPTSSAESSPMKPAVC